MDNDTAMNNQHPLPENDRDLRLARRLNATLPGDRWPEQDDPLLPHLKSYFRTKHESDEVTTASRGRSWSAIQHKLQPSAPRTQSPPRQRPYIPAWSYWAAAAVLVISAFVLLYVNLLSPGPELIAQSQDTISTVTLADGSEVTLRPHTRLYDYGGTNQTHRYKLEGEAFFDVTHDPARRFEVETSNARVSVLGTQFDLSSWRHSSRVYLQKGRVSFSSLADTAQRVVLHPGQSSLLTDQHAPSPPAPANAEEITDWMRNQLVFHNQPARTVLHELEQHFNLQIAAPDTVLNERLSGRVLLQDRGSSLADVGLVLGGRFEKVGTNRYRFIPNPQ